MDDQTIDIILTACFIGITILIAAAFFIYALWEDLKDELPGMKKENRSHELVDAAAAYSAYDLLD